MKTVRIGVVGLGAMGNLHLQFIKDTEKLELTAACDNKKDRADAAAEKYNITPFYDYREMFKSGLIDAVIVATPHYSHTPITIDAFEAGLHVITEKPIAAHAADAEKMIEAHRQHPELKWAAMFQLRTLNIYKKLKTIIDSGEIGKITRVTYLITNSFRTQAYYDSGTWRATWEGEGGGVLLNQCPHFLDLFQWFFGMSKKLTGYCGIGKFHNIEVEDDVTSYMELENGATAVFITSTGDAPGTNRLEITADKAKVIVEQDKILITKNRTAASEFLKTSKDGFAMPDTEVVEIVPEKDEGAAHQKIISNFTDSILNGAKLIAEAEEGLNSLILANAMLYSSIKEQQISMPFDSAAYEIELKKLISDSNFVKNDEVSLDESKFTSSFNK